MNLRILKKLSKRADQYLRVIPHCGALCLSEHVLTIESSILHNCDLKHCDHLKSSRFGRVHMRPNEPWKNTPCYVQRVKNLYDHDLHVYSAYEFLKIMMVFTKTATPKQVFAKADRHVLAIRTERARNLMMQAYGFGGVQ